METRKRRERGEVRVDEKGRMERGKPYGEMGRERLKGKYSGRGWGRGKETIKEKC